VIVNSCVKMSPVVPEALKGRFTSSEAVVEVFPSRRITPVTLVILPDEPAFSENVTWPATTSVALVAVALWTAAGTGAGEIDIVSCGT